MRHAGSEPLARVYERKKVVGGIRQFGVVMLVAARWTVVRWAVAIVRNGTHHLRRRDEFVSFQPLFIVGE